MATSKGAAPPLGTWVVAETAARADLSGGWSDTPPITYEHGGAVTNVALLIDGQVSYCISTFYFLSLMYMCNVNTFLL